MFDGDDAVDALTEAAGEDGPPVWAVFDRDDGLEDGFVLRQDPDRMLGWRAPAECWALGMAAGGTARVVDDRLGSVQRCQVTCVVDRWGAISARVRLDDGRVVYDAPEAGRMLDVLARCLGLPTPPPADGPAPTLALLWLSILARQRPRRPQTIGWMDALGLHPLARLLGCDPGDGTSGADREELPPQRRDANRPGDPGASVVVAAARLWTWEDVRSRCVAARIPLGDVSPEVAAWMDDGMLSRWFGEVDHDAAALIDTAFDLLGPEDHGALRRVLLGACGRHASVSDGLRPLRRRRGRASCGPRSAEE